MIHGHAKDALDLSGKLNEDGTSELLESLTFWSAAISAKPHGQSMYFSVVPPRLREEDTD